MVIKPSQRSHRAEQHDGRCSLGASQRGRRSEDCGLEPSRAAGLQFEDTESCNACFLSSNTHPNFTDLWEDVICCNQALLIRVHPAATPELYLVKVSITSTETSSPPDYFLKKYIYIYTSPLAFTVKHTHKQKGQPFSLFLETKLKVMLRFVLCASKRSNAPQLLLLQNRSGSDRAAKSRIPDTHGFKEETTQQLHSPFRRNAAEITKTEKEIARDPLPVIAMLDTCSRLAALNHLETAMGWNCRHMGEGGGGRDVNVGLRSCLP